MSRKWYNQAAKIKSLPPNWEEGQYKGVKPVEVQAVKHSDIFRKGPIRFVSKEEYKELCGEEE